MIKLLVGAGSLDRELFRSWVKVVAGPRFEPATVSSKCPLWVKSGPAGGPAAMSVDSHKRTLGHRVQTD